MDQLERVAAALRGKATDRPPYSLWTHLPGIDLDPERLAEETAAFCARYKLDFVKAMPNGLYAVEDWGCECDFGEVERGGIARVLRPAVRAAADWPALGRLDVARGAYGRELSHLARLVARVGPRVPVLATVFSPLTVAAKLSNGGYRAHLATEPEKVAQGLECITEVTCAFVREAMARGCAGVFLAVQEASPRLLDEATYRAHGEPHDRRVLEAARVAGGWFNVVHMHGEEVLFDLLERYEAAALNWHIGEALPSIREYRARGGARAVLGGLQRAHVTRRDRAALERDIARAMAESGGRGILLAPGCVIRHPIDEATLAWLAEMIRALAKSGPASE